jgi:hypothetical protein
MSWVKELDILIKNVDNSGKVIKNEEENDSTFFSRFTKSKLDRNYKTEIVSESKDEPFYLKTTFYHTKAFIFAEFSYSVLPIFYKGRSKVKRPINEIEESKKYFKNDSIGIEYSRKIDVFSNQNIDSLKNELQKKPFEEKMLTKEDNMKEYARLKKMQK